MSNIFDINLDSINISNMNIIISNIMNNDKNNIQSSMVTFEPPNENEQFDN